MVVKDVDRAPSGIAAKDGRRGNSWSAYLPAAVIGLVLACLVLPPIAMLLRSALFTDATPDQPSAFTLDNFGMLFGNPDLYSGALNSTIFAFCSTILSLLLGGAVAWVVERTDARFRRVAFVTTIISLATPQVLYVSAWLFLLGRVGPVNQFYRFVTGADGILIDVYSIPGMVFIEGLLSSPLVFLLLSTTFRRANAEMEEAARMSGASVLQTVWRVSMRMALPAIFGLGIFIFVRNIESFDVPVLIGMPHNINMLTTEIYLGMSRSPPQIGYTSAFSVALIVVVAVLLHYYRKVSKAADRYASVTGKSFRPRPFRLGRWRWVGAALVFTHLALLLVFPMAALLWNSLTPFVQAFGARGFSSLTLTHYEAVFHEPVYATLALSTIAVTAAAATLTVAITAIAAWLSVRRWPGSAVLEQLSGLPLVFPGVVLGVAMLQIALRTPFHLYGTMALIVLAFMIRFLPYGMRYASSGVIQLHRELEEAAGVSGASRPTMLGRIVAPLLSPSLIAGWMFIFMVSAKEISMVILLAGPTSKTISLALYDQWTNGNGGEVAALGIVWSLFMSACALILSGTSRRIANSLGATLD